MKECVGFDMVYLKKILCTHCESKKATTPHPINQKGKVCNDCWLHLTIRFLQAARKENYAEY